MRTISNTIISIAALVMFFTFALAISSLASDWNHMHDGSGWSMMHNSGEAYGLYNGHMGNGYMGNGHMGGGMMQGGMMYGGHMMNGGHMYGNTQAPVPCEYNFTPRGEVPTTPSQ